MRAAAYQFDVRRDGGEGNLAAVLAAMEAASAQGARLLVLPEMWPTSFPDAGADLAAALEFSRGAQERVRALGEALDLVLVGSSFGTDDGDPRGRPPNRLQVFDRGREALRYDKVHLFSPTAETEVFTPGEHPPATVATSAGRLSGLVCYDLRFPELTRRPWRDGAEVVCVPAQWPSTRARHFRALCAGLAVSGQCFVIGCNRVGRELVGRRELVLDFPGNSLLVDPHGEVLAEGDGAEGLVCAELDLDLVRELRRRVPVARDLRADLYARWDRPD